MRVDSATYGTIDIAVSGLRASNRQMQVVGSNIANIQTTDAGDGQPYRRLIADFDCDWSCAMSMACDTHPLICIASAPSKCYRAQPQP